MNAALENLKTNQQQLDQDGVMVGVSRQALDETLALVEELLAEVMRLEAEVHRLKFPPSHIKAYEMEQE